MHILYDTLYVACNAGVVGFNLSTTNQVSSVAISGIQFLNDITSDSLGFLYITDYTAGRIYKLNPMTQNYSTFVSGLTSPNGLLYDPENNRMLVCHFTSNANINAVDLADSTVTLAKATSYTNLDGLARDSDGNVYVSAWGTNTIYRFDAQFTTEGVPVSDGHNGPADIFINKEAQVLAVPNFNNNSVDFISLITTSIDLQKEKTINSFTLYQNYPNPFNPSTTIKYDLTSSGDVSLKIFNLAGQEIAILFDGFQSVGEHTFKWQPNGLASGIYFYRLQAGSFSETKKLLLQK